MAYVLVHEEDWNSYGTDINAVSNNVGPDYGVYVYWDGIGSNLAGHSTTVGPTAGPNSGPGISDLAGSGGFVAKNLNLRCRDYKLECLYDFTGWSPSSGNFTQPIFRLWWGYPYSNAMSENSGMLLSLQHNVSGALVVSGTGYNSGTLTGVVPTSGNVQFRVQVRVSTISGTPGSFSAATDGYVKVYINDVLEYDTGAIALWHDDASIPSPHASGNWSPYINIVELGLHGKVGLWRVYESDDCLGGEPEPDPPTDTERNLLTGYTHTITGSDNVIAGTGGTLTGDRTVLLNLDGTSRSVTRTGALELWGNFYLNGTLISSGASGGELSDLATLKQLIIHSIVTTGSEVVIDSNGHLVFT